MYINNNVYLFAYVHTHMYICMYVSVKGSSPNIYSNEYVNTHTFLCLYPDTTVIFLWGIETFKLRRCMCESSHIHIYKQNLKKMTP